MVHWTQLNRSGWMKRKNVSKLPHVPPLPRFLVISWTQRRSHPDQLLKAGLPLGDRGILRLGCADDDVRRGWPRPRRPVSKDKL